MRLRTGCVLVRQTFCLPPAQALDRCGRRCHCPRLEPFLNRDLNSDLIVYRQIIGHYNQLVDQLMAFQASPLLWVPNAQQAGLEAHAITLIEAVHLLGIGDVANSKATHWAYIEVGDELGSEQTTKVLPVIWAVTGFNLYLLKRWGKWI